MDALLASGLSLDAKIRLLVQRYGDESVKQAVSSATAKQLGRREEDDWSRLMTWIEKDVDDWLEGRDPFSSRSNYVIANEFHATYGGQSSSAVVSRILRKLRAGRRERVFAEARCKAHRLQPVPDYLATCRRLRDDGAIQSELLDLAEASVSRFRAQAGEPSPDMTMQDVELHLQKGEVRGLMAGIIRQAE